MCVSVCHPPPPCSKGRLPLVSSLDHTEGSYKFKPGKGIINFCKESPNFRDMLYCLLHGRPLALIGRSSDEQCVPIAILVYPSILLEVSSILPR